MSTQEHDLYSLVNHLDRVVYEFANMGNDRYQVTRVWLNDNEREYMGTYPANHARSYWDGLVRLGFVRSTAN